MFISKALHAAASRRPRLLAVLGGLAIAVTTAVTAPGVSAANAATPVQVGIQWHQVAALPAVAPAAVRASTSCSGYGCDNKDPVATGCADGNQYTVLSGNVVLNGVTFATILLRYSPTCGTNWAQVVNRTGDFAAIRVCRDTGDLHCSALWTSAANLAWSNQMYAYNVPATAYATLYLDGGQGFGFASA